jgi:hypothetical protein
MLGFLLNILRHAEKQEKEVGKDKVGIRTMQDNMR